MHMGRWAPLFGWREALSEGREEGTSLWSFGKKSWVKKSSKTLNFEFNKMRRCNRLSLCKETAKLWGPLEVGGRSLHPASLWTAGLELSKPLKDSVWFMILPRAEKAALFWKGLESLSKPHLLSFLIITAWGSVSVFNKQIFFRWEFFFIASLASWGSN